MMSIKIRFLEKEEIIKAKKLYDKTFNDPKDFTEWFFAREIVNCEVLGGFVKDELVTVMFLNTKPLILNGQVLKGCYIYGVATEEKYRGRGYAKKLMDMGVKSRIRNGYEIIYLIPVNEKIYRGMNFKTVRHRSLIRLDTVFDYVYELTEYDVWRKTRKNPSKKLIGEISEFAREKTMKKKDVISELYADSYFYRIIEMNNIEGGNIYVLRNSLKEEIKAVAITGSEDGKEKIISIICEEDYMVEYLCDLYNKYKKNISNLIKLNPIMIYDYDEKIGENIGISINDEV